MPPPARTRHRSRRPLIVPGFVDVHVHGIEGIDVLDGPDAVADVAARLPKYGVTAFCPTSVACTPQRLTTMLDGGRRARGSRRAARRRACCRRISRAISSTRNGTARSRRHCLRIRTEPQVQACQAKADFAGDEILRRSRRIAPSVGIVTLAPELPGGLDLVRDLVAAGHRVSLGHTGATYDEARAAIDAGAHHATHLFNRMSSITSRSPGVVGAVLESDAVAAEIICDGHHVHPSLVSMAIRVKSASRMMAITDGTAVRRPAGRLAGAARRSDDHRRRAHRGARGRHARRQHPDDGRGVPDAGDRDRACRCRMPRGCARRRRRLRSA